MFKYIKSNKKALSLIVAVCVLLSMFAVSCGNKDESAKNNNTPSNSNNSSDIPGGGNDSSSELNSQDELSLYDPMLPEEDFKEHVFKVLTVDEDFMSWSVNYIDVAEQKADPVDDAIYTRNRNIESKYNIVIEQIRVNYEDLNKTVANVAQSGGNDYDLVVLPTTDAPISATNGYFSDLGTLPYINLEKPWWNKKVGDNFSIGGRTFFTVSDLILMDKDHTCHLLYNKKVAMAVGAPSSDALYKAVNDGKWTWDMFKELTRDVYMNLDGTGKINYATDRFGVNSAVWWFSTALMAGFNETIIRKDIEDMPYLSCKTEKFMDAYVSVVNFAADKKNIARMSLDYTPTEEVPNTFERDGALFSGSHLSSLRSFRNMESDFALLPMPKWDESQDTYYSLVLDSLCIAIPVSSEDVSRSAFILEALTAESARLVNPAYYKISLEGKFIRDEESKDMLDIILENRVADICYSIYNWGGFTETMRNAFRVDNINIASILEKNENRIMNGMGKTIDAYELVD